MISNTTTRPLKQQQQQQESNMKLSIYLLILVAASFCHQQVSSFSPTNTQASQQQQQQAHISLVTQQQQLQAGSPVITPFAFNDLVQENQRLSLTCTITSGDSPVTISWLKDGQLLTPSVAQARRIIIHKPDLDISVLKFNSVKLEHAGNYTCLAKNHVGQHTHSAQLIVRAEPRWLREPLHEPIVATRGQTIVIDCQTTGYPKPQQTWKIKNRSQNEFEPLAATGKISLAANGSLVIRNADKADEANYLCISTNGVGKGISWSTPLKVNVPAHFRSTKQITSVVRKHEQVQLRCDASGDEPISIEWYKNKLIKITNDLEPRYSIYNNPIPNGLISVLNIKQTQRHDNAIYECVARNQAGKDRLPIELLVQEEPDNIQELQTTQVASRSVSIVWTEPYDGRSRIGEYRFQYRKADATVQQSATASRQASADEYGQDEAAGIVYGDDWQQASILSLPVAASDASNNNNNNNGNAMRSIKIERLEPSSKYLLRAQAVNSIGRSKFSQPLEFTTDDEAPEFGPSNIRVSAINSTSIHVSWDEIARGKQSGRIHGYYIGYRVANTTAQFIQKPFLINNNNNNIQPDNQQMDLSHTTIYQQQQQQQVQRLETSINDLRRDTSYEIIVAAFNSRGTGPASEEVVCKTIEMEAPRPVKLSIRRESNESIFIEWHRDPLDQNPIDDYVLYQEKNSLSGASQESLSVRLPGNQSHYKAPGLKCGTRYQFYIIAQNKVGKSPASEIVSASTSGNLPVIPGKMSLIKLVNSTCLLVNLNSFQDNGCRIKTFTVRYRIEKTTLTPNGSSLVSANGHVPSHAALVAAAAAAAASGSTNQAGVVAGSGALVSGGSNPSEWITIRPRGNAKLAQREEDRMEYLCDLDSVGEYTIHVAAANDVGRSEMQYTVQMASDELRYSLAREMLDMLSGLPNVFTYIPSMIVFLLAGLFLSLVSLILYTTVIKYYQKFIIIHNQLRATRRAKRDEKRRRKLNQMRQQKQIECWEDQFDEEEAYGDDEDDEDDDSSAASGNAIHHSSGRQYASNHSAGHYMSNISNSAFDTSSIDSPCNGAGGKYGTGSCLSTISNDSSIHTRFQCLNSKSYVKMNEYTMLPSISANLSMANDIYGTVGGNQAAAAAAVGPNNDNTSNSLYYSTLRRSNMQTYLPHQSSTSRRQQSVATMQHHRQQSSPQQQQAPGRMHQVHQQQQQQQANQRRSQNVSDIYGYYLAPPAPSTSNSSPSQQDEAANSIFVPPQHQHQHQHQQPPIIYSAPNIRRQPVFL